MENYVWKKILFFLDASEECTTKSKSNLERLGGGEAALRTCGWSLHLHESGPRRWSGKGELRQLPRLPLLRTCSRPSLSFCRVALSECSSTPTAPLPGLAGLVRRAAPPAPLHSCARSGTLLTSQPPERLFHPARPCCRRMMAFPGCRAAEPPPAREH